MPERFKVVCIPCKALYKCSALLKWAGWHILRHKGILKDRTQKELKGIQLLDDLTSDGSTTGMVILSALNEVPECAKVHQACSLSTRI